MPIATFIGIDVIVVSDDPDRVKLVTEALAHREDLESIRAEKDYFYRRLNAEGESHRVTQGMLAALRASIEQRIEDGVKPIRDQWEAIRAALQAIASSPREDPIEWPAMPPLEAWRPEDPEDAKPLR